MSKWLTYARAVKIYDVMSNPVQTKAIVLMPDGVCEYFDLTARGFKEMLKLINSETRIYDARTNEISWDGLCKFYGAHPVEDLRNPERWY